MMKLTGQNILILGAGKIGSTIADMAAELHEATVTLADMQPPPGGDPQIRPLQLDIKDDAALTRALQQHSVVINALPFFCAERVARAAARQGVHYFDLTEDVAAMRAIQDMAAQARSVLMPQCGLAPGLIGMLGGHLAQQFDELFDLQLRVGALTRHATNALRYHFTWSVDGVINEYCKPCNTIVNGQPMLVPPLEGVEALILDGENFEAFNTSGGLGTLCETLEGKVRTLNYRTIRYPGHAAIMKALLNDLRLRDRRDVLKDILENAVPSTTQDVVIIFVTVAGWREGRLVQETYARKIYSAMIGGQVRSAIQITTASSLAAMLDLLAQGKLPQRGFLRQEDVKLAEFLGNRFGAVYAPETRAH